MCANASSTSSSSSPFASSRSLFSRLTSPLKSRTRNLTDFHIRPLEPHRQYSPGDLVKGAVVLTVVKPIRITHLTVCLHGFVRVSKNANGANDSPVDAGLTASNNHQKSQYFGNGHASLFQDEITLCGEGRLDIGIYEFNFELEFPSKGLPTSIDFERGTISYKITSTITRPTSIAATSSCDQKISLVETVDIGPIPIPKARTISLEPISKRARKRKTPKAKEATSQEATEVGSESEAPPPTARSPHPDDSASQCGSVDQNSNPQSPVSSEMVSNASAATGSGSTTSSSTGMSFRLPGLSSTLSKSRKNSQSSLTDKTITATIELLQAGCLPGDNLPLKISIKHTKPIKSMHGIIITLYRQGRIDSAPPLSLFVDVKGKAADKLKHEEYYPKSKTGLGGLSLSSAGSSSLFRKDLGQTFAPILIDPSTLSAVVNATVRVPEDVFPTISGVPGEMISFKYYVEVVVDLGGKLAGQQRHLPRLGAMSGPSNFGGGSSTRDGNSNMLTAWGGSIVNTDQIRREKSVVACLLEVVVGTTDSARKRGRANSSLQKQRAEWPEEPPATPGTVYDPIYEESYPPNENGDQSGEQHQDYPHYVQHEAQNSGYYRNSTYDEAPREPYPEHYPPPAHSQIPVPPPEIQTEEGLSEKARAQRAEERLLPSRPPQDPSEPSFVGASVPPPHLSVSNHDHDDLYSAEDTPRVNLPHNEAAPLGPPNPSAPTLDDLTPTNGPHPSEDKQELERQRMLAEASAPLDMAGDEDDNAGEGSSGIQHEASAPNLTEDDEYGEQYAHPVVGGPSRFHETLPRYER